MNNFIYKIDYYFAKLLHHLYSWGGEIANHFMDFISHIAEAGILFLVVGFGLALFKRTRKIGATILISVAFGFLFTNIILKNAIERARPFANITSDFYKWWLDAGANYESGFSFPSGHTTATTAFAVAIFLATNKKYSWPILLLPFVMASSRIYLMVHYFSDCVGGLVVGTIASGLAYAIMHLIYKSDVDLFIWLREFDITHPKGVKEIVAEHIKYNPTASASANAKQLNSNKNDYNNTNTINPPVEEFIYKTQAEENQSPDTTSTENTETQPKNKDYK